MWIKIIKAFLTLAISLVEYASRRQLIKTTQNAAMVEMLENANKRIQDALAARRAVADSMPEDDKYRRD